MASFGEGDDNTAINLVYVSTMHFGFLSLNGAAEVRKCGAKSDERDTASKKGDEKKKATARESKRRRRERHREKKKRLAALKPLSRSAVCAKS